MASTGFYPYPFWCHSACPNLSGRKGLPIIARIALLDSRMKKYQHARIGTIETTFNAGTILTTLYINFYMSLKNNRLLDALRVQLQIVGVDQDPQSLGATLHYQMAYRIQNHAIDLALPITTNALMISLDSHQYRAVHIFQGRSQLKNSRNFSPVIGSLTMKNCISLK